MANEIASKEQVEHWARQIGALSGMPTYAQLKEQLEAAKQRELELLAVIKRLQRSVAELAGADSFEELSLASHCTPPQALHEHEAKVLEEAADNWSYGSGSAADILRRMAEERRKK